MESSQPDVQFGKLFIILWIGFMLFIIISIVVVYFNAKKETSSCEPVEIKTEKSENSSMGRTPKLFIAFLAITAFAVSTMNLTYKINYFEKKKVEPVKTVQNILGMVKNLQKKQMAEPLVASAPPLNNNEPLVSSAPQESNNEGN